MHINVYKISANFAPMLLHSCIHSIFFCSFAAVILLLCIVCKRKRKLLFQSKAADAVYFVNEPDVWSEIERIDHPDPFAQNSGHDVENNDIEEALYDSIDDYNIPLVPRGKSSYEFTQLSNPVQESTPDKTVEEQMTPEYNIPKVPEQGEVGNYYYISCIRNSTAIQ